MNPKCVPDLPRGLHYDERKLHTININSTRHRLKSNMDHKIKDSRLFFGKNSLRVIQVERMCYCSSTIKKPISQSLLSTPLIWRGSVNNSKERKRPMCFWSLRWSRYANEIHLWESPFCFISLWDGILKRVCKLWARWSIYRHISINLPLPFSVSVEEILKEYTTQILFFRLIGIKYSLHLNNEERYLTFIVTCSYSYFLARGNWNIFHFYFFVIPRV